MEHENCYNPQCPRRETCTLWHNALLAIEEERMHLGLVNPLLVEAAGGYDHCPQWHEYKLRRYARGLVWSYPDMTIKQLDAVRHEIERAFGRSNTVRMRCGYVAISPEEQGVIANIFAECAPGHEPRYQAFEEHYVRPQRVEGKAVRRLLK